jgi:cysteine-rich repeat protein
VLLRLVGAGLLAVVGLATGAAAQTVTRGPYLQLATPTGVLVRWRTDVPVDSLVRYGETLALGSSRAGGAPTTEHAVTLTGLTPGTLYFYSVGTAAGALAGGDASHFFTTSPDVGSDVPTRIWVLGDSGKANDGARAVRDAYRTFAGAGGTDVWLMLGDNAYEDGTDLEFQAAVFDMYPDFLRQVVLWPTFGNHDSNSASSATQSGPYYDIFSLPRQAEAGGVASGTEAYYSFDYGRIHFVCLDSDDSDRSPAGPMLSWLAADLAATSQEWVLAFWHHPAYTRGYYDSDVEVRGRAMRENALPILEAYGVDVVFAGHDHSYQRSFLVDGHYGLASSFTSAMALDPGDGRETGTGAYAKPGGFAPHAGAVYVVAGTGATSGPGPFDHPITVIGLDRLGSVVLDVFGGRLDARFLDDLGGVVDSWTLTKGPDVTGPSLAAASALGATRVAAVFTEPLDEASAETAAHYAISPSVAVSAAELQADLRTVWLTTEPLVPGLAYTLAVAGVEDRSGNAAAGAAVGFELEASATREVRIANGADDVEQRVANGAMTLGSSDLELVDDGAQAQLVGLRFPALDVPPGANVEAAWVQFQADEVKTAAAALTLAAHASDDAAPFTAASGNVAARPLTAANVAWAPAPWSSVGEAGAAQRTPDLAPIVQEIVDRPGWASGNALVLVVSGIGVRTAESFEGAPSAAPLFHVEYSVAACGNGAVEAGETCDDGNTTPGDGCSAACLVTYACGDGVDNDGDAAFDFDGGASANGGVALGPADPHCGSLADADEAAEPPPPLPGFGCGLGPELMLALGVLGARRARRERPGYSSSFG